MSPRLSVPLVTSTVATADRPLVETGFDDQAACRCIDRRLELKHFGLQQQNAVEQRIDALPGQRRDRHKIALTAVFLGHDALGDQLLLTRSGLAPGLSILLTATIIGIRSLGVRDSLLGLRHDAVVGCDHKDHDVSHLGATRTHRGEGLVAGVSRKAVGDHALRRRHMIGANVLRNAAGFAAGNAGTANLVEQRGLPWSTWPMMVTTGGRTELGVDITDVFGEAASDRRPWR